jgi:hypothetical protein
MVLERQFEPANRVFERVYPIQKRLKSLAGPLTAMVWGVSVASIKGQEAEGYNMLKTEIDQWRAFN